MENLKNILEALVFAAGEPLSLNQIKNILPNADSKDIRDALQSLEEEYETRKGGFYLRTVADGYQIRSRPEYKEWIKRLIKPKYTRFSKAALETLAIIAYRQPVIRSDIEHIRGVDSGGVIRMLLERKMVKILGRKDIPGRPLIYTTTKNFLEVFDLKNLKDLPTLKEIEEFAEMMPKAEETSLQSSEPGSEAEQEAQDSETDTVSEPESEYLPAEQEADASETEQEHSASVIRINPNHSIPESQPDNTESREGEDDGEGEQD